MNILNEIQLKTGLLKINVSNTLYKLCDFGSRINKKRGFVFVSKVLGKHLPVKPSLMKRTYKQLSELIPKDDIPTLFIGFAETATALGHGVFEEYNSPNSFYIHTTRYKLSQPLLFSFSEEHSHASTHFLYLPRDIEFQKMLKVIKRVILIDDEVTTGQTAYNLINELKKKLKNVEKFYLLTILNWSNKFYNNFKYLSLIKGSFDFIPNNFINIDSRFKSEVEQYENMDDIIPYNFGRLGIRGLNIRFDKLIDVSKLKNKKVLVLGTSEFMYLPYLLALYLEKKGINCFFQSTTRSPLNIDGAIKSRLCFKDNYFEEIDNFLYNVLDKDYDKIFICYETTKLPSNYFLKKQLNQKFEVEEIFFKENEYVQVY